MKLSAHRFLQKIRQELDALGLTDIQKDSVVPRLLQYAEFLDKNGGPHGAGSLSQESSFFDVVAKVHRIVAIFHESGLTLPDYLQAATAQPELFYRSPTTVAANINDVVERFSSAGLTVSRYLQAALKQPQLFCQSPDTIADNVNGVVEQFANEGLTMNSYLRVACHRPSLFCYSSSTVVCNVRTVANEFCHAGLTLPNYLRAATRQPALLYLSPATITKNIHGVVERFADEGLTLSKYLQAAVKQPQLFCQTPATIAANVSAVVEQFASEGLTAAEYLQAACRHPPLYYQSPATIIRHMSLIRDMFRDNVIVYTTPPCRAGAHNSREVSRSTVVQFVLANPVVLSFSDSNLALRRIYQEVVGKPQPSGLLLQKRQTIERRLMRKLGHPDSGVPISCEADPLLVRLVREEIIKSGRLAE